ncbi:MAG: hypothetical protein HY744_08495 [Deltaproteobacteria bacterium]|nr:hypothetical protein [Deltaproteobacteria bacterium]
MTAATNPPRLLLAPDRATWRKWLARHHAREPEIWLVYYKKRRFSKSGGNFTDEGSQEPRRGEAGSRPGPGLPSPAR